MNSATEINSFRLLPIIIQKTCGFSKMTRLPYRFHWYHRLIDYLILRITSFRKKKKKIRAIWRHLSMWPICIDRRLISKKPTMKREIRPQMLEKVMKNWAIRLTFDKCSRCSHLLEIIFIQRLYDELFKIW